VQCSRLTSTVPAASRAAGTALASVEQAAVQAKDVTGVSSGAGLGPGVLGLVGICLLSAALDSVLYAGWVRWQLAGGSALVGLLTAGLGGWHVRRGFPGMVAPHVPGVVATVLALIPVVHLLLLADPLQTVYLMLTIVASGAMLSSLGWLVAVDVVCLAGFTAVAVTRSGSGIALRRVDPASVPLVDGGWVHFGVALVVAVAVGHVLYVLHGRDRKRVQALTDQLIAQALHDPLTGLLNRRGLATTTAAVQDRGRSEGRPTGLGVVCFDIDGFKTINDELGHAAGDAVLVEVAERLRALVRDEDVLARVGGDEFVIAVPATPADLVVQLAHRAQIRLSGTAGVLALPWAVSVGVATSLPGVDADLEVLMHAADMAMYDDKQARRRYAASEADGSAAAPRSAVQEP